MTPNAPIASMGLVLRRRYFGQKVGSRESWLCLIRRKPCHRRHPTSTRIAAVLVEHREMLQLRSGLVIRDICSRFRCGYATAALALTLARREVP